MALPLAWLAIYFAPTAGAVVMRYGPQMTSRAIALYNAIGPILNRYTPTITDRAHALARNARNVITRASPSRASAATQQLPQIPERGGYFTTGTNSWAPITEASSMFNRCIAGGPAPLRVGLIRGQEGVTLALRGNRESVHDALAKVLSHATEAELAYLQSLLARGGTDTVVSGSKAAQLITSTFVGRF